MRTSTARTVRRLAAFAALCIACSDPLSPTFSGVWALKTVGGDPLPAFMMNDSQLIVTLAETLSFHSALPRDKDQVLERRGHYNSVGDPRHSFVSYMTYRRDGNTVQFIPPYCGIYDLCTFAYSTAVINGDTLTIDFPAPKFRDQVFVRVR